MKIAAFDLDGTIYLDRHITPQVCEAIAAWRAAGHLAVSASGKSIDSAMTALVPHGVEMDYHVLYNGTVITDPQYRVLDQAHLPADAVADIVGRFHGTEGLNIYTTGLKGPDTLVWRGVEGAENNFITNPAEAEELPEQVVLLCMWAPGKEELQQEIAAWVHERFPFDTSFNTGFFDIMPAGFNKGTGLTRLLDLVGYSRDQVELYTFGDSNNDIPMHQLADAAFSFPHATAATQAVADEIVPEVSGVLRRLI